MLCIVIKGPTWEEVVRQVAAASDCADSVELRLDMFSQINLRSSTAVSRLKELRRKFHIPMIFTLRSREQGESYSEVEERRLDEIRLLAELKPEYLDLEYTVPRSFVEEIAHSHPEIRIILSYHNFIETPFDLESLYQKMHGKPAHWYKIAVTAQSTLDALRLLAWAQGKEGSVIAISMGMLGQISRILGPIIGSPVTYASLDDNLRTAPGQLSEKTLNECYHFHKSHRNTKIYGLIGDPVDSSISDQTHNALMDRYKLSAVYVKIPLKSTELAAFFSLVKKLPFHGLSVTMPLKESVIPFLDQIDPEAKAVGAVNTLLINEDKISGYNTDGMGALDAIERKESILGKRVVIVGAGGAAKAICYEACRRGASVTILNRNAEKAHQIASRFNCSGKGLDQMPFCASEGYDILINTTSVEMPIPSDCLYPGAIIMDIKTRPLETELIKYALKKELRVIYGYQMFVEQAVGQFSLWFGKSLNAQDVRPFLDKQAAAILNMHTNENSPQRYRQAIGT